MQDFFKSLVFGSGEPSGRTLTVCCCTCTGNMQVLALTAALCITVTSAQTVGAVMAHSESMLADTMAMWVDCMTYVLNILTEACAGYSFHRCLRLAVPAVSLCTLIYVTVSALQEAIGTLEVADSGGDSDDVKPVIVLAFSAWSMSFDAAALCAFARNWARGDAGPQLNMMVASAHVAADLLRSVTTLVESVLILGFGFDGTATDAWAGVIVSAIILLGVLYPLWSWLREVLSLAAATCGWGEGGRDWKAWSSPLR